MIDTGLFYKCYGMEILSPKEQHNKESILTRKGFRNYT